jgi:hypothetical protein
LIPERYTFVGDRPVKESAVIGGRGGPHGIK